jgi:hypothetical protein
MARQFLTNLNLNRNELQNARIQNLANDPSGGVEGQVYYNSAAHEIRVFNGTEWEAVGLNGVTATAAEINILDGATLSTSELNILDGATVTFSELNILDGATLDVNELNILDGATITATELNVLDGVIVSTAELNHLLDVTSNVQDQLDTKAPIESPTFTGTVTVPTSVVFEGVTADDNETTLTVADPTADRTITLPDNSGTVILNTNTVNELAAPVADFSLNNNRITGLAAPVADDDAATKGYVDALSEGLNIHAAAHAIAVATLETITGGTVTYDNGVDGVGATLTLSTALVAGDIDGDLDVVTGDRVIIAGQTNSAHNGVYVLTSDTVLTRASDFDTPTEMAGGDFIFVTHGTGYADTGWVMSERVTTVGTDPVPFIQFSGAGSYVGGAGLTLSGNTFDVVGTANRITVNPNSVDIASTYAGQSSITTVGTVSTGTWEATDVAVAHGGTGASTAAGARANLGATTKYTESNAELTPSSGAATWIVTHSLSTKMVLVQLFDTATGETVEVDVARTDVDTVTLSWVAAGVVTTGSYQVVIIG